MPASYAHYRFGKHLLPELPADKRQCVQRFRRMFDVGLHGPDLFFYHIPFPKTRGEQPGKQFHGLSGREIFTKACAAADSEASQAYLYGLLAHYCLDIACHPYIQQLQEKGTADHIKLEAEFDRYLMALDGITEPHRHDMTRHLKLTRGECMTVSAFYPGMDGAYVSRSLWCMAAALRFLAGENRKKREKLLKKIRPVFCDFFIPRSPVDDWLRLDSELLARFSRARMQYPILLEQLDHHIRTGEPLGEDFSPTFGG